jgi:hypothetical protein
MTPSPNIFHFHLAHDDTRNLKRAMRMVVVSTMLLLVGGVIILLAFQSDLPNNDTDGVISQPFRGISLEKSTRESAVIQLKDTKVWARLVVLPLVAEVGAFVLFQRIGISLFLPLLQAARRLLLVQQPWNRIFMSTFRQTLPKTIRNVPRFLKMLFRKRSRLSVASEFTNFVGNEEEI